MTYPKMNNKPNYSINQKLNKTELTLSLNKQGKTKEQNCINIKHRPKHMV